MKWDLIMGGLSLGDVVIAFYYLSAAEIWPYKSSVTVHIHYNKDLKT